MGTFRDPNCRLRKKEPKNVLCGRLCWDTKQRKVKIVWACRGERGLMDHLLHVQGLQEPINFRLQSLKKYSQKGRVEVQTKNCMGLGEGKRVIESPGGLGGIEASGHTWQQKRKEKNETFCGPSCRLREKEPKKVLFTSLRRNKKRRGVRSEWAYRGVGG